MFLCRSCESRVLQARLRELVRRHPSEAILAAVGLAGFLYGFRFIKPEVTASSVAVIALGAFWLAFMWAIRRPRAMCKGIFLLRREELAAKHSLPAKEIEVYVDVPAQPGAAADEAQRDPISPW